MRHENRPLSRPGTLISVLLLGLTSCITVEGRSGQVGFGFEAGTDFVESSGTLASAEVEFPTSEHSTITGRILSYDYEWEEDEDFNPDEEEGSGTGFAFEYRYYPKQVMDGFYIGAGLGLFPVADWEFRENGVVTETGDSLSSTVYGSMGYAIRAGEHFTITPTFAAGSYISDSPESGPYAGLGIRFSFGF
jgi:hypothetical protein